MSLPTCIAVVPATACDSGWLPCARPRCRGALLCAEHQDAFLGVILGFQDRLKLPEQPYINPRIVRRFYANLHKTKRTTRRLAAQTQSREAGEISAASINAPC